MANTCRRWCCVGPMCSRSGVQILCAALAYPTSPARRYAHGIVPMLASFRSISPSKRHHSPVQHLQQPRASKWLLLPKRWSPLARPRRLALATRALRWSMATRSRFTTGQSVTTARKHYADGAQAQAHLHHHPSPSRLSLVTVSSFLWGCLRPSLVLRDPESVHFISFQQRSDDRCPDRGEEEVVSVSARH